MGADPAAVDLEEVFAALRRDPGFADLSDADFADATNVLAHIAGAVSPHRLGQIVTVQSFFEVAADFLASVLKTPFDIFFNDRGQVRLGFELLEADFRDIAENVHGFLSDRHLTEATALLSQHFEFIPEVRNLIKAGQLTFYRLIHLQPGVFLPRFV